MQLVQGKVDGINTQFIGKVVEEKDGEYLIEDVLYFEVGDFYAAPDPRYSVEKYRVHPVTDPETFDLYSDEILNKIK